MKSNNKKYRLKAFPNIEAFIVTEQGRGTLPVVYQFRNLHAESWHTQVTSSLDSPQCCLEKVPEEPIGVGYSWIDDGYLYKVVYVLAGHKPMYLVTNIQEGEIEEYHEPSPDDNTFWDEDEIRQESSQ